MDRNDVNFEREDRYLVLKRTDIEIALTDEQSHRLFCLAAMVHLHRKAKEKPPLHCVVVEHDWPEYEPAWKAIENRMAGEKADGDRN